MHALIIDTNNQFTRFTHTLKEAKSADGFPIGGLYGVVNMVARMVPEDGVNAAIAVMDWGAPAWRFEVCPEYKQQRAAKRTDEQEKIREMVKQQLSRAYELFKPAGITTARAKNFEGDDTISALVRGPRLAAATRITVLSSDKDFVQLLDDPRVRLYDPMSKQFREPDEHYLLKRACDPKEADNLDGVTGVGAKTADTLIEQWQASDLAAAPTSPDYIRNFIAWAARGDPADKSRVGKGRAACAVEQQKIRANWRCTNLRVTVDDCDAAMKFRRATPDRAEFKAACKAFGIRPFMENFIPVWGALSELKCPV